MKLYETVDIEVIGCYELILPGKDIFAVSEKHARLALIHHGRDKALIVEVHDLDKKDKSKKVTWDSLIVPSKLQEN